MRQTAKALSKKLFGPDYGQLKRALPIFLIVFFGLHLSGIRMKIAPSVLYLSVFFFSAGILWRLLSSEGRTDDMRHLMLLPFSSRSFVCAYLSVLGAYTLLTKTAGLLAVLFAIGIWRKTQMICALLCFVYAVLLTTYAYTQIVRYSAGDTSVRPADRRNQKHDISEGHSLLFFAAHLICRIMSVFWPVTFLILVLFRPGSPAFLPIIIGGSLHALILLSGLDAYLFFPPDDTHSRTVQSGKHVLVWRYLFRYLLAHKNYLLNTAVMWIVACLLPLFFGQTKRSFALPIGFAVLSLNTPICILLSCDPDLEQALRSLPRQWKAFAVPYCLFIFLCNLSADGIFLVSYALQCGGTDISHCIMAALFAISGAIGSVLLEWFFPLHGWKTENDLWHHPRKYVVPAALLILAGIAGLLS